MPSVCGQATHHWKVIKPDDSLDVTRIPGADSLDNEDFDVKTFDASVAVLTRSAAANYN